MAMDISWISLKSKVSAVILKTITEGFKYTDMTPVQVACIPQMLNYKDVVAEAVTGGGKTLAFLVPMLEILLRREEQWKKHQVGGIVIAPTRELAHQISTVLDTFLQNIQSLTMLLFIGGTSIDEDLNNFQSKGGNILIATPGRLHDLLLRQEGSLLKSAVKHLEVLVLDEADCLLSMGFERALNAILQMLPKQRRTGLFSATQTTEVQKLIRAGLRNPVSVVVKDKSQKGKVPASLDTCYAIVEPQQKFSFLLNFIRKEKDKKILLFFATCACVDYFAYLLNSIISGIKISSIHGKKKEKARLAIFEQFRNSDSGVLCCTDVMARGIDITKKIHWVVQFDPPSNPASFIHRSGRTARNGEEGRALLLLQPSEEDYVSFIQVSQKVTLHTYDAPDCHDSQKWANELKKIQKLQLKDKGVFESAVRAFVSYYKAYSKYECKLILRVKDLDLGSIAYCYGLLKFPKMSEFKGVKPGNFEEVDCDINAIPYKDKQKELSRKRKLETYTSTGAWPENKQIKKRKVVQSNSWSIQKEKRAKKLEKMASKKLKQGKGVLSEQEILSMEKSFVNLT